MKIPRLIQMMLTFGIFIILYYIGSYGLYFYVDGKYDHLAEKFQHIENDKSCSQLESEFRFFSKQSFKQGAFADYRFEAYEFETVDLYYILNKDYLAIAALCDANNIVVDIIPVYE